MRIRSRSSRIIATAVLAGGLAIGGSACQAEDGEPIDDPMAPEQEEPVAPEDESLDP